MAPVQSPWKRVPATDFPLEDELASRGAWLIRLRWFAAIAVLAGSVLAYVVLGPEIPIQELLVVGIVLLAYNALFRWILDRLVASENTSAAAYGRFASAQFLTDWGALILLVHLTGGVASPLLYFFVFHAIIASILLPPQGSYLHAAGGITLVVTLAILEATDVLPNHPVPAYRAVDPHDPTEVTVALVFFSAVIFLSNHLAGSIARRLWARTRELVRVKDHLQESYVRTRTLHEIARAIHSTLNLDEVLQRIVESTAQAMDGKAASIRLLDDDGKRLLMSAACGLSPGYLAKGEIELERSPVDLAALQGWAVKIPDVADSEAFQYPEDAVREGIRSVLVAPLILRGQPLGVLRLYDAKPREFTDDDMRYLMTMAGQGAGAIQNARTFRRLEELEEAKSRFVFMIAHELKAPVASARSGVSLLEGGFAGSLSDEQRRQLDRVDRKLATLQDLVRDLLALGSLKNRLPSGERADVRLVDVLNAASERVASVVEAKGIRLGVQVEDPDLAVRAAGEDLDRLVGNLLDNAVKYTPDGGSVQCTVTREGPRACIEVADTGIGIPEDAMPKLFQEFFRAGNARQFHEGTGLGLALVHRLVKLYGGEISVQSVVGKGSTFTVRLPACPRPE